MGWDAKGSEIIRMVRVLDRLGLGWKWVKIGSVGTINDILT